MVVLDVFSDLDSCSGEVMPEFAFLKIRVISYGPLIKILTGCLEPELSFSNERRRLSFSKPK